MIIWSPGTLTGLFPRTVKQTSECLLNSRAKQEVHRRANLSADSENVQSVGPKDSKLSFKKAKGIQKHFVKKELRHQHFLDVLTTATEETRAKFRMFRCSNHVINTVEVKKCCLSAFDDKRYILDDGISTLAYGHDRLRRNYDVFL